MVLLLEIDGGREACVRPNGLRLSGDGGEADGVRCSRGLGGGEECASTVLRP